MVVGISSKASKLNTLRELLEGDLNFHEKDSTYASHNFHAFAAKFPPQLPKVFIQGLTDRGDTVLDPMMGSGTTIVEAFLAGRRAIGFDIDPLAVHLCRVKVTPLNVERLTALGEEILNGARWLFAAPTTVAEELPRRFDPKTREFIDYWFLPDTQRELMALIMGIENVKDEAIRDFLELTFSSIIITKSGGVSIARDLAHTRPHRDETKVPQSALAAFEYRLKKNIAGIAELRDGEGTVELHSGDARALTLADESVDLVVTSPPYANAIDYMRAHKFSLVWFGSRIEELTRLRATYIGSERVADTNLAFLTHRPETVIRQLARKDPRKAKVLRKYFTDMSNAISEMYRVLRPNTAAIIVVGTSTMRGINVETHLCLADIAAEIGFQVVGVANRQLDRNRRMMPARFKKSASMIEQRIHEEHVIGLLKTNVATAEEPYANTDADRD